MDRSRKANRTKTEVTLQHRSADDAARLEEMAEEKLRQLLVSLERFKQTSSGVEELRRRSKSFGKCKRSAEETSSQFYDRLRHWLQRPVSPTKLPRHRPRQNEK